ncbi:MAG: hypothetical protein ABJB74_00190 [Gemmatimonas sp.]
MHRLPKSFEEFDALLTKARAELDEHAKEDPSDNAITVVQRQLEALHGWTRGGRRPAQSEKDQLNFGHIASRALDFYPVARDLYNLSTFVIYWDESTPMTS